MYIEQSTYQVTVATFQRYLWSAGYSVNRRQIFCSGLREFLTWLDSQGIESPKTVKPVHLVGYYTYLKQRPNKRTFGALSPKMVHTYLHGLKLFYFYLQSTHAITENPFSVLDFPTPQNTPREILTRAAIEKLYNACETLRDKAILGIYYGCGLRASEGEHLNTTDLRLKENLLYVRKGKGGKRRVVPLGPGVKRDLEDYICLERDRYITIKTGPDDHQAILLNNHGTRMRSQAARKRLQKLARSVLPEKSIALHDLRHAIATHLLQKGMPFESIREFLGHKYLESTQLYARYVRDKPQDHDL